ncbi:MAG: serine/threonine protein phosphatase, partial [Pseudomonadota bacterium]|nr:serine/threonine protein phosphatase [Pseudomonadota bacterium]
QIVITGPPCSGKSTLVKKLGGWPEEGALDLAQAGWWKSQILTFRPREVHFNIPFIGFAKSHAVFDPEWVARPSEIDYSRILLPPPKRGLFSSNWRIRYAFNFQLPSPERLYAISRERLRNGTHRVDSGVTLDLVGRQVSIYAELARYFHRHGMIVWVRDDFDGLPLRIDDSDSGAASSGSS